MSPRLSLFVLSIFLILLLPLPVYLNGSGLLPAAKIMMLVFSQVNMFDVTFLFAQVLAAVIVCILVARLYIYVSQAWPIKIRGSVVGIISLLMLVAFSSVSIYQPLSKSSHDAIELRELYHW
jgi:hypothetical protein